MKNLKLLFLFLATNYILFSKPNVISINESEIDTNCLHIISKILNHDINLTSIIGSFSNSLDGCEVNNFKNDSILLIRIENKIDLIKSKLKNGGSTISYYRIFLSSKTLEFLKNRLNIPNKELNSENIYTIELMAFDNHEKLNGDGLRFYFVISAEKNKLIYIQPTIYFNVDDFDKKIVESLNYHLDIFDNLRLKYK